MKNIIKKLSLIICGCLVSICALTAFTNKNEKVSTPVRNVELVEQSVDYQQTLNEFDEYYIDITDTIVKLDGIKKISLDSFEYVNNLSEECVKEKECSVSFKMSYDVEKNIVTIYAYMNNEFGIIETDEIKGVGFINDSGDIDAAMNIDGECILLSEMKDAGMIQNCGWFKNLIKKVVTTVVATTTIAVVAVGVVATVVATAGAVAPILVTAGLGAYATGASCAVGALAGYALYETCGKKAVEESLNLIADECSPNNKISSVNGTNINQSISYNTFDDVLNNDYELKNKLNNLNVSKDRIKECLATFLNLNGITELTKFYNTDKRVLCIGRDIHYTYENNDQAGYQNYAYNKSYWRFWVNNYDEMVNKYTEEVIKLANTLLVKYCCKNNWDFILVTNPYHYMEEHLDIKSHGGYAYSIEIKTIRSYGYNNINNNTLTWNSIPNPGNDENGYFRFAGYYLTR